MTLSIGWNTKSPNDDGTEWESWSLVGHVLIVNRMYQYAPFSSFESLTSDIRTLKWHKRTLLIGWIVKCPNDDVIEWQSRSLCQSQFMAKYKCTITPPFSTCKSFNVLFPHFIKVFKWLYQQNDLWRVKIMMVQSDKVGQLSRQLIVWIGRYCIRYRESC